VLRFGSLVLASVLLGVPRAFESRTFGAQESVYVEVSPLAPELLDFARELERALLRQSFALSARRCDATTVIDILSVARSSGPGRPQAEAIALTSRDGRRQRRLVLHYRPGDVEAATRELLACLGPAAAHES
jgi:hypothetical protein